MGHHLFIHDEKSLAMRDLDVALVRHLLIEGANQLGDEPLASAIANWEYQGPGIWVGIDEAVFVSHGPVFDAAITVAQKLGSEISADYLNKKAGLPGGRWEQQQATSVVVALIRRLENHLHGRT